MAQEQPIFFHKLTVILLKPVVEDNVAVLTAPKLISAKAATGFQINSTTRCNSASVL